MPRRKYELILLKRQTLLLYPFYQMRKLREEKRQDQSRQHEAEEGEESGLSNSQAQMLSPRSTHPFSPRLTLALNLWPFAARLSHGNSLDR